MTPVRRLRWTEQAVDQLGAIAEYVSRSSPIYAEQLIQRIVHRLEQVRVFPDSGSPVLEASIPDVRQVIEWPYRILYRPRTETIEVLAIVHGRRDLQAADIT
ncbi:MAG: type II toxin-antitoxin system RelE/ParE family toxin [Gemmatimonadaceae bacterium]